MTRTMTRKNRLRLVAAVALLMAAPAWSSDKHAPYSLIFGTVFGADQHPAAGVKVRIRRSGDKKAKWELVSDRRGEFAQRLPAPYGLRGMGGTKRPPSYSKDRG